jgi:uncharacterized protein
MNRKILIYLSIVIVSISFFGCATYYQKTIKFQDFVSSGNLEKADNYIEKDKKSQKQRNILLYYMNRGTVNYLMQNHDLSIQLFSNAERSIEDYRKNLGAEALSLISNPSVKPYKAEDFEVVFVNYYLALNYLMLGKYDEALVEARRINIRLNELNDKYKDNKNRYQRDAFAHVIMGLIFDATKNYNDAFIAYRNAVEVYEEDYAENFNVAVPEQLKYDLLRAAYRNGFNEELRLYEKKFNISYNHQQHSGGELVFLWHNGFGPVKSEWSINFSRTPGNDGYLTLVNEELGLNFQFYIGDRGDKASFSQLDFLRIAFPKYVERQPIWNNAELQFGNKKYPLSEAQNINEIAFKTLHDRMVREMANSLLRLATKKAMEYAATQENENIGAVMSIANALTEKADTRNWQTLPYAIHYTRVKLPEGENNLTLKTKGGNHTETHNLNFTIRKNKTQFFTYQSLESKPIYNMY